MLRRHVVEALRVLSEGILATRGNVVDDGPHGVYGLVNIEFGTWQQGAIPAVDVSQIYYSKHKTAVYPSTTTGSFASTERSGRNAESNMMGVMARNGPAASALSECSTRSICT